MLHDLVVLNLILGLLVPMVVLVVQIKTLGLRALMVALEALWIRTIGLLVLKSPLERMICLMVERNPWMGTESLHRGGRGAHAETVRA